MRWLAVDLGKKRIGLAVGESETQTLRPLPPMTAIGTLTKDAEQVAALAAREEASGVVLGLPYHADGQEAPITRVVKLFGEHLSSHGLRVALVDETGSSRSTSGSLYEAGLKGSEVRKRLDSEVACRLLQEYFHGESEV